MIKTFDYSKLEDEVLQKLRDEGFTGVESSGDASYYYGKLEIYDRPLLFKNVLVSIKWETLTPPLMTIRINHSKIKSQSVIEIVKSYIKEYNKEGNVQLEVY